MGWFEDLLTWIAEQTLTDELESLISIFTFLNTYLLNFLQQLTISALYVIFYPFVVSVNYVIMFYDYNIVNFETTINTMLIFINMLNSIYQTVLSTSLPLAWMALIGAVLMIRISQYTLWLIGYIPFIGKIIR